MHRSTEFTFGIPWIMSFFHQDWTLDASTEAEAVANQFVEELEPASVLLVRRDARLLLDNLSSDQIKVLWEGCADGGEYFFRRGRVAEGAEWMRDVIAVCDTWLSHRSAPTTLTDADAYEGRELADQILASVQEFRSILAPEVADALGACSRSCTPDLAFRLLLRALVERSASRSPGHVSLSEYQYARLNRLGSAFNYGEFVVSDVRYLVEGG
ncbi:hypothetical protein [Streptomyces sp. BK340]|uniref:hypothetical protein n=1 Tax=Streptomyces sp. BK340 TaxID=2572903 RepID=UPI0011A135CE|nr:hypothetical protein [Streptomyces sp. BK340]TVZ99533.1 hypothetical protein FB157_101550 [Streptomyces sp. BK340]